MHREEDASMHGFQAVTGIWKGARDDYAHGVIEVCTPHLIVDVNLANGADFDGFCSHDRLKE